MKHKHYEMIVAKAANMDLIIFHSQDGKEWKQAHDTCLPIFSSDHYFLCLPQHKDACLHWLNGGEVQYSLNNADWFNKDSFGINKEGMDFEYFNSDNHSMRIKPRKEKRWIGVYKNGATTDACLLKKEAENHPMITEVSAKDWQFIEIEVEV